MDPTKEPGIDIAQVIVERAHFEHREDYLAVPQTSAVGVLPFALKSEYAIGPRGEYGLVRLTLTTDREKRPLYNVDIAVLALVRSRPGAANMPLEQYARVHSAGMLFPFVRELVASLTGRGRFGPVWLHPVNLTVAASATAGEAPGGAQQRTEDTGRPRAPRRVKVRRRR